MKALFSILIVAIMFGCSSSYIYQASYLDFSKLNEEGFFISTTSIGVNYQSIGVFMEFFSKRQFEEITVVIPDKYNGDHKETRFKPDKPLVKRLVDIMKEKSANGIIELKLIPVYNKYDLIGYNMSGLLIKK
ncbi:MAG: hypothetical protein WCJ03_08955 [Bacteroidales bacterium]